MAIPSAALNILTFPQEWRPFAAPVDGQVGELGLNLLVLPKGDPLAGLVPAFADATLGFEAHLIAGLDQLPTPVPAGPRLAIVQDVAERRAFFDELLRVLNLTPNFRILAPAGPGLQPRGVKKFLTSSYRETTRYATRRTRLAVTDSEYECDLREGDAAPMPAPAAPEFYWPEILGFVLRQPELAVKIGVLYRTTVPIQDPNPFGHGGYLYVDLGADSDHAGEARQLFAARIPSLGANESRTVFAPVLFPVGVAASFDQVFPEAELYDDGFARLVHGSQPPLAAQLETSHSTLPAVKDVGIRLAWDDEQVAIWLNRQLGINAVEDGSPPPPSPLGIAGYRVDVWDNAANRWQSLQQVTAAELRLGDLAIGPFDGELSVEVLPANTNNQENGFFWLPSYFTSWAGASLAIADPNPFALAQHLDYLKTRVYEPVGADSVALRYGNSYRFRVRLMDMTGGGPGANKDPRPPTVGCETTIPFRRYVPPKTARVVAEPAVPVADTAHFEIARPELGYPDVAFTGKYADPVGLLLAQAAAAQVDEREPTLPDPDVTRLRIDVQVRTLRGDPAATADIAQPFAPLYSTVRAFPPEFAASLGLDFVFQDLNNLRALTNVVVPEGASLPLPRGRDIRLIFTPLGDEDAVLEYWGSQTARVGAAPVERYVRAAVQDERALFQPAATAPIQGVFLQPDPPPSTNLLAQLSMSGLRHEAPSDLVTRLAHHLDLPVSELTFGSPNGRRLVYGCSSALRHVINPDGSSITFSSKSDLTRHWVVAVRLLLDRDWTWDALAPVAFELQRQVGAGAATTVATVVMPRVVNLTAAQNPDRDHTELVIFDGFDPKPTPGVPLAEWQLTYTLVPHFAEPPAQSDPPASWLLTLPITTPPTQVPRIMSAGFAFSEYQHDERYSSTAERRRMLYLELDGPPLDAGDRYFARVLAYGPDPVLVQSERTAELPSPAEPPLPIDPEVLRSVVPGQSRDCAGIAAMQQLTPSPQSDRHYLLPLPPGLTPDSPELFGFFVYELRVGHDCSRWSTAQGRFGSPLRISGVQHPAPQLRCAVTRSEVAHPAPDDVETGYVFVDAPYAAPVWNGVNIRDYPMSELWALLYVQVMQADGQAWRNVLLLRARARLEDAQHGPNERDQFIDPRLAHGRAVFGEREIHQRLIMLGLPLTAPLSVLSVETLPEPASAFQAPLDRELGQVRFLRTSTLTPVPATCPPESAL